MPDVIIDEPKKIRRHYTYSDFFAFTAAERGFMSDIKITSTFLTSKPKNTDTRSKSPKGKWKDYDTRPKRAVSFLGINRILPPSESLTYRNYCGSFGTNNLTAAERNELAAYMKAVFGKDYSDVSMSKHNKYRLYGCTKTSNTYTGFNMGAGENAVLQLMYEIISAGKGALIVVDELELGLHVQAQRRLIQILKEICLKNSCQIICSSHSATILASVPPEGRIMVKPKAGSIDIQYGISVEQATSELSGTICSELEIMVEDDVAKAFIEAVLPCDIRRRVDVMILGSADDSMLHAMATHLREGVKNFMAIMDGDKRADKDKKIKSVVDFLSDCSTVTSVEVKDHLDNRITFLPGNEWPEKVIMESLAGSPELSKLMSDCKVTDLAEMKRYLQSAMAAGKHNEFYELGQLLHLDESTVRLMAIQQYDMLFNSEILAIVDSVSKALS